MFEEGIIHKKSQLRKALAKDHSNHLDGMDPLVHYTKEILSVFLHQGIRTIPARGKQAVVRIVFINQFIQKIPIAYRLNIVKPALFEKITINTIFGYNNVYSLASKQHSTGSSIFLDKRAISQKNRKV